MNYHDYFHGVVQGVTAVFIGLLTAWFIDGPLLAGALGGGIGAFIGPLLKLWLFGKEISHANK